VHFTTRASTLTHQFLAPPLPALDSESEKVVQRSIDKITGNAELTTISIAHRLSSIQKADRIAVIKDGKVKEIGTYEELTAKPNGHFRRLQAMQFGDDVVAIKKRKKDNKKTESTEGGNVDLSEDGSLDKKKVKANAKRARLLASKDTMYFVIGGVGAVFAGAVFPAWGCKWKLKEGQLFDLPISLFGSRSKSYSPTLLSFFISRYFQASNRALMTRLSKP
jgi:hypothetical protein